MFENLVGMCWYVRLKERGDDNTIGARGVDYFLEEFGRENVEAL